MHFGLTLDSSDIDLLDTDLALLDTEIPSKHFFFFFDSKTFSRHVFKTCFEDIFSVTIFCLPKRRKDEKLLR